MMPAPKDIQLLDNEVAILWNDGQESFIKMDFLRSKSPSAENVGEVDILGNQYGGCARKRFPGVTVNDWEIVGNYAIRFTFSDGHTTGIYSFSLLREIA
jgi:DUF971 family protein